MKTRRTPKPEPMPAAERRTPAAAGIAVEPGRFYPPVAVEAAPPRRVLLPANLAGLARLCAKENARYSLTGVRLTLTPDGYRADATNGRYLGTVTGPYPEAADQYPEIPALESAPAGAGQGVIPVQAWEAAFKLPPRRTPKPILAHVAAALGRDLVTFAATDLERARCEQSRLLDGKFPDVDAVLPKKAVKARVRLSAKYLTELVKAAAAFCTDGTDGVEIELRGEQEAVIVRTANGDQKFTGVLMPLC